MIEAMDRTVAGRLEELDAATARRRDLPDEARTYLTGVIEAYTAARDR